MERNLNEATKKRLAKLRWRRNLRAAILDSVAVFLASLAGVIMNEMAMDIQKTQTLTVFREWSIVRLAAASVIAIFFMVHFERGGDLAGKKKNVLRRVTHAFGQGAALRGLIEFLALLFVQR